MKIKYAIIILFIAIAKINAQGVAINTTGVSSDTSAILDVSATNKGVVFPRMTTLQRNTILTPTMGLIIFNLDVGCYQYFDGSSWFDLCGGQKEKPLVLPWRPVLQSSYEVLKNTYQDKYVIVSMRVGNNTFSIVVEDLNIQIRSYTLDMPSATLVTSSVVLDSSLYLLMTNSPTSTSYQVFKYDLYNINAGGILVSFVGLPLATPLSNTMVMTSNGTDIYFNYNAGNSANDYVIARYSITSPTVFTYQNSITCGSTSDSFRRIIVDSLGNLYGGSENTTNVFLKYSPSGTYYYQIGFFNLINNNKVLNWSGDFYLGETAFGYYMKFWLQ